MPLLSLHGVGVARGCVIAKAALLTRDRPEVAEYTVEQARIDEEVARFRAALSDAKRQLHDVRRRIPKATSADVAAFIDAHLLMLEDGLLTTATEKLIRERYCNAEWALKIQRDSLVRVFEEIDDDYLSTRKDDVDHVVTVIQRILLASENAPVDVISNRLQGHIVVADDLTPADTLLLHQQGVLALVTEYGGPLSHTAILARSLELPSVVGVKAARRYLQEGELIVVDGEQGVVLAGLDEALLAHYRRKQQLELDNRQALQRLKGRPAVTCDGVFVDLQANIEIPEDTEAAARVAAPSVGLYRTEFLFMNRADLPDEQEHFASYMEVIRTLKGCPITIRSVDLGADKQVDGGRSGPLATNPALGLRGIRLCLREPSLIEPQLRAVLRASHYGPVRLMIPMLSNLQELFQTLKMVEATKAVLREQNLPFDENLPIGGMVEVPAAAVCAPLFARYLDFLSIGTNDLIQYTLAIDRIDDDVNYLYDPLHPAVLSLIHGTIQAGRGAAIPVGLCGEMAGDPRYTRLLLGLGLTQFSMHPANLLEVKQAVTRAEVGASQRLVKRILHSRDAEQINALLREITGV